MTAEKIIDRIKKDSEKEIKKIMEEAEKKSKAIIEDAKKEAKLEAKKILQRGEEKGENIKKILISKANQEIKRDLMKAREKIIEECFTKAHHKLSVLHEEEYKNTVRRLMKEGYKKLGECTVIASREIDREIAKDLGLQVSGYIEVSGGILLKSKDGKVIDNTFEGILKRKKDEIRIEVGKLLGFGCY